MIRSFLLLEAHLGLLPGKVGVAATEVPVLCRLLINGALQVQLLDDVAGAEVKVLHHDLRDVLVSETA